MTMLRPFLTALRRLEPDWEFTVYVSDSEIELPTNGITTVVVRSGGWRRAWLETVALDRRARRDNAVLLLNLLNSGPLRPRLPGITWQRNALYFDRRWLADQAPRMRLEAALRRSAALLACRASAVTVVPSHAMGGYVRDWRLARRLAVEVVPHGVEAEQFSIARDRPSDGHFTIGVMGHAASHRGLATAVHVLDEVRKKRVNARLLLTVPRHGNPAFQSIVDGVAETVELLGLSEHVVFGGATKDPAAWYRRVDLLLIPSECESFCFPLIEGFASGLPVVTSGLLVHREIAGDLALHGSTYADMASHVLEIYGESEYDKKRRQHSARRRAEQYSWGQTALAVQALVREVLRSGCR